MFEPCEKSEDSFKANRQFTSGYYTKFCVDYEINNMLFTLNFA